MRRRFSIEALCFEEDPVRRQEMLLQILRVAVRRRQGAPPGLPVPSVAEAMVPRDGLDDV